MAQRILLVDDSEIILEAVANDLRTAGFDVTTTTNPLLVASELRRIQPDLVLLDVDMPALKGPQIVAALRRSGVMTGAIVLYSATTDPVALAGMASECGAVGSIPKSVTGDALLTEIRGFLARTPSKSALVVATAATTAEASRDLRKLGYQPVAHDAFGLDRPLRTGDYELLVVEEAAFGHPSLEAVLERLGGRGLLAQVGVVVLGSRGGDAQLDPDAFDAGTFGSAVATACSAVRQRA